MMGKVFQSVLKSYMLSLLVLVVFTVSAIFPPFLSAAENFYYSTDDYSYGSTDDYSYGGETDSAAYGTVYNPIGGSSESKRGLEDVADSAYDNAGGWGLKSALIFSASSAAKEYYRSRDDGNAYDISNVFSFTKIPQFWGGLAGDLTFSMVVAAIAPSIPGGIFVQTLATVGAGFVGYELGSGNIKNTDWLSIGLQTLAATITHLALASLLVGVPFAGLIAAVASIGAALGVAYLIKKMREKSFSSQAVSYEGGSQNEAVDSQMYSYEETMADRNGGSYSKPLTTSLSALVKDRDEAYREYLAAVSSGSNTSEIASLLSRYRECDGQLAAAREQAASAGLR
jgi:hypothetical protein